MVIAGTAAGAIEYALRGLAQRADVRADNVANLSTPGFRAARVDFETALRSALASGDASRAGAPAVLADPSLPGPHNNTVNLESEIVGMMKDNLTRDALTNTFNAKVGMLRAAVSGR